jgi:hypothetical protein
MSHPAQPQPPQKKKEIPMYTRSAFLALMTLIAYGSSVSQGATLGGTVKDPQGAPLEGVFVQAQNKKINATFMALSDSQGQYRLEELPAGNYQLAAKVTGFDGDPASDVNLKAEQRASVDLALHKSPVRWNEISIYQAGKLWPASAVKDKVFSTCFTCHGFQTRMASVRHDTEGWLGRVRYMQAAMSFGLADRLNDRQVDEIAAYLNDLFGEKSVLPESPEQAPEYKDTVRPISSEAMNITFVEYDMPSASRMPFSAAPDKNGNFWIPNFGVANKISRLDPKTGAIEDFPVPNVGTAAVHSAVPGTDGTVWLTEQGSNKVGVWDPHTHKITEFQDAYIPGKLGYGAGSKHTVRLDPGGNAWSSGNPLTRLDRNTRKFTRFEEMASTYDVEVDGNGNIWFTRPAADPLWSRHRCGQSHLVFLVQHGCAGPFRSENRQDRRIPVPAFRKHHS